MSDKPGTISPGADRVYADAVAAFVASLASNLKNDPRRAVSAFLSHVLAAKRAEAALVAALAALDEAIRVNDLRGALDDVRETLRAHVARSGAHVARLHGAYANAIGARCEIGSCGAEGSEP